MTTATITPKAARRAEQNHVNEWSPGDPAPLIDRVTLICGERTLTCERITLAGVLQLGGGDRLSVTEQMFDLARDIVLGNLPGGVR